MKLIDNAKGENDVLKYKLGNEKHVELSIEDVQILPAPIKISKVEIPLSDSALIKPHTSMNHLDKVLKPILRKNKITMPGRDKIRDYV